MAKEKLTPWDAPLEVDVPQRIAPGRSLNDLLGESGAIGATAGRGINAITGEPRGPYDWGGSSLRPTRRPKSKWRSSVPYIWYIGLVAFNFLMMFIDGDLDAADIMNGASIGFVTGIMLTTWLHRQSQDLDDKMRQVDRDFERMDQRMEMARVQREAQIMVSQARRDAEEYVRRALGQR